MPPGSGPGGVFADQGVPGAAGAAVVAVAAGAADVVAAAGAAEVPALAGGAGRLNATCGNGGSWPGGR
jgi:hypothetical protein